MERAKTRPWTKRVKSDEDKNEVDKKSDKRGKKQEATRRKRKTDYAHKGKMGRKVKGQKLRKMKRAERKKNENERREEKVKKNDGGTEEKSKR